MGTVYKRGKVYWIKYFEHGKPYFESTKTDKPYLAKRLLKVREGEIEKGEFHGLKVLKTRIDELADLYLKDYELHGYRGIANAKRYVVLIKGFFGGMRASNIGSKQIDEYRLKRQGQGVEDSTVNRELSALKRMFRIGLTQDPPLVSRIPKITFSRETNIRKGFFDDDEFLVLRGVLPDHVKVIATIGYYTGMRLGEILKLRWKQVDFKSDTLRLEVGETKTYKGRTIPMIGEVKEALLKWQMMTLKNWPYTPWVCHFRGKRIYSIKTAWKVACEKIGLQGKLFHDFRRTAVRNLIRAGVPQPVAMKISGHRTSSVFNRYDIVSEADLLEATQKLSSHLAERRTKNDGYKKVTIQQEQDKENTQAIEN